MNRTVFFHVLLEKAIKCEAFWVRLNILDCLHIQSDSLTISLAQAWQFARCPFQWSTSYLAADTYRARLKIFPVIMWCLMCNLGMSVRCCCFSCYSKKKQRLAYCFASIADLSSLVHIIFQICQISFNSLEWSPQPKRSPTKNRWPQTSKHKA